MKAYQVVDMIETGELQRYFEELRVRLAVVDETKKEVDRLVAPDFNLFSILRPDESRISEVIGSLLDPSGSHGQGRKFLEAFLEVIHDLNEGEPGRTVVREIISAWTGRESPRVSVKLEQATNLIESSQRRMDILLDGDGYGVMIENKPWAGDQQDQLPDYAKQLRRQFERGHVMIYLSGDGSPPSRDSFTAEGANQFDEVQRSGNFQVMAYRPHLTDWLDRCLNVSKADRVRWVISDLMAYVEQRFSVAVKVGANNESAPE